MLVEIFFITNYKLKYPQVIHSSILSQNTPSPKNNKVSDKQFNNFRRKYWKWRSNNLE
ncbi:hypothetical protein FHP05_04565 [Cerasibacillus terrae]|uniref:LHH domain-containing protein n=1 Tax=Cerasibacillus terrae TaxID=2498845 RepID=A0A5C8P0N9_9BACI|nr:hypothetical protein FHP05_04565 [Cerasibacillus terrae]